MISAEVPGQLKQGTPGWALFRADCTHNKCTWASTPEGTISSLFLFRPLNFNLFINNMIAMEPQTSKRNRLSSSSFMLFYISVGLTSITNFGDAVSLNQPFLVN
jgi:hypothetical protein